MKYDAFSWEETSLNDDHTILSGRLHLKLSSPGAVFVTVLGYETLLGFGTEFREDFSTEFTYRVEADAPVRAFVYVFASKVAESLAKEIFTNADRQPQESGSVLAVKKALRTHALEQQSQLRETRRLTAELQRERKALRDEYSNSRQKTVKLDEPVEDQVDPDDLDEGEDVA